MIRIRKLIIIISILFTLLFTMPFYTDVVRGAEGVILITDWDDVSSGLDQNETDSPSGFFTFKNVGSINDFETSADQSISSANSIKCYSDDGAGYINLTTDFEYIYQINFSFYASGLGKDYIRFYDEDDNKVIEVVIDGANYDIDWRDDSGLEEIYNNFGILWYHLIITHTGTNQFNIKLVRYSDQVELANVNYAGCYAGTWTNFSYIHITSTLNANAYVYIDNFYIDLTPDDFEIGDYEGDRCSNPWGGYDQIFEIDAECEVDWLCVAFATLLQMGNCINCDYDLVPAQYIEHETEASYNETIRHVLLPVSNDQLIEVSDDPTDYRMLIDDTYYGVADFILPYENGYGIVWEDVNHAVDGKILFSFGCDVTTSGFLDDWYWYGLGVFYAGWGTTRVHNSLSNFYDGILSGTFPGNYRLQVCWYYNDSGNVSIDPDVLPIIDEFDNVFGSGDTGEGYVEFLGYNQNCYYRIGNDYPRETIVYNVSGFGPGNGTKTLLYQINKVRNGTHDEIVYNGFIEIVNRDYTRNVLELYDFDFDDHGAGQYYIMVYNTSSYGIVIEEFVHRSNTIRVCPESGADPVYPEGDTYYGLPYWVPWIIGIFITLFVTMSPLIIALYITRNNRHKELPKIPGLVYVGFFYMGLIICVLMSLLPSWLPFVILFGMVTFFAVQWLFGKKSGVAEAE